MITYERVNANGPTGGIFMDVSLLLGQLSTNAEPLKIERFLQVCLQHNVFVARDDERLNRPVVGTATLVVIEQFVGKRGRVEDVIVDSGYRGKGIGRGLMEHLHAHAKVLNVLKLTLTSKPEREIANELYPRLGYKLARTNVYTIDLSGA